MTTYTPSYQFNAYNCFNFLQLDPQTDLYGDICKTSVFTLSMWILPNTNTNNHQDQVLFDLNGIVQLKLRQSPDAVDNDMNPAGWALKKSDTEPLFRATLGDFPGF
jgi:hypothetical protein